MAAHKAGKKPTSSNHTRLRKTGSQRNGAKTKKTAPRRDASKSKASGRGDTTAKKVAPRRGNKGAKASRNQNKTRKTAASVSAFLAGITDERQRADCKAVVALMKKATGEKPAMWGSSIVGFGKYHYEYDSGREGDFFLAGVSPRKGNLTVYIMPGFSDYTALLDKLGKHKTAKSCLYIKRLSDVDSRVLERLIERSVRDMRRRYPS